MKLRISVTKEILEKSKMCGLQEGQMAPAYNCAIALAVRDIFPDAAVCIGFINIYPSVAPLIFIDLPAEASIFISRFDKCPIEQRVQMDPISFEVEVPDEVINRINIDEIEEVLKNHPTLQFV